MSTGDSVSLEYHDRIVNEAQRKIHALERDVEELQEFQNSIANRMPERYDGDEAQEAIINRWLDDIASGRVCPKCGLEVGCDADCEDMNCDHCYCYRDGRDG